jgi:hypothetical protein
MQEKYFLLIICALSNLRCGVAASEADINHYAGIARYFRAWFYINKVQAYSDLPWIDRPLSTTDEDLYVTQTPRAEVVQHILEDLDFAVQWIKPDMNDKTRIHKYCALALLSRFALHEATFRKYHPELNLASTVNELLHKSITASEAIRQDGRSGERPQGKSRSCRIYPFRRTSGTGF